jgi:hypothetical protein
MKAVCPKCGSDQIHSHRINVPTNNLLKTSIPGSSLYFLMTQVHFKKPYYVCNECKNEFKISHEGPINNMRNKMMGKLELNTSVKDHPAYKILSEILLWIFIAAMMFFLYKSLTIFELK